MIEHYSDHAANERTYLAWVRTGIAVVAFGFVIEKFNLFMLTLAGAAALPQQPHFERLAGSLGKYEGLAFMLGGVALISLATLRFVRTTARIDSPETHSARSVRLELLVSGVLVLLFAAYCIYLALE